MTKATINGKPSVFVQVLPPPRAQRAGQNRTQEWASIAIEMAEESLTCVDISLRFLRDTQAPPNRERQLHGGGKKKP